MTTKVKITFVDEPDTKPIVCIKYNYPGSYEQTKSWRQSQKWWHGGKKTECDKIQRKLLGEITGNKLLTDHYRFNKLSDELIKLRNVPKYQKLEYMEDLDANFNVNNITYFFNLKFVCDSGGAQTRTLSLVYDMVKKQLDYLSGKQRNAKFFNIIDGDESWERRVCFDRLLAKYPNIKTCFVGDMNEFELYWYKTIMSEI